MLDLNVCYRRLIATAKTLYIRLFDTGQQQSIANAKSADIETIRLDTGCLLHAYSVFVLKLKMFGWAKGN